MNEFYLAITDDYGNLVYVRFTPFIVGNYGESIAVRSNCRMVVDDYGVVIPVAQFAGEKAVICE